MKKVLFLSFIILCINTIAYSQSKGKKSVTKYAYVITNTNEPNKVENPNIFGTAEYKFMFNPTWYFSEIFTIDNWSEEKELKIKDQYRYNMERKMNALTEASKDYLTGITERVCTLIYIDIKSFTSYKEVSYDREHEQNKIKFPGTIK